MHATWLLDDRNGRVRPWGGTTRPSKKKKWTANHRPSGNTTTQSRNNVLLSPPHRRQHCSRLACQTCASQMSSATTTHCYQSAATNASHHRRSRHSATATRLESDAPTQMKPRMPDRHINSPHRFVIFLLTPQQTGRTMALYSRDVARMQMRHSPQQQKASIARTQ